MTRRADDHRFTYGVQAHDLTKLLEAALADQRLYGAATWLRFDNWTREGKIPTDSNRGGGTGEQQTDQTLEKRRLEREADKYQTELDTLTRRIAADLNRLRALHQIANPDSPRRLKHSDMTAAQLIADGWCPSCFRDHGHLAPLAAGRYADRCRACGDYRAREQQDPPMDALRIIHTKGKALRQRVLTAVKGA